MAKKRGGSVAGLLNQKKRLRAQLTAINKKKREAQRATKLRRELDSLKGKVKTARKRSK